MAPTWNLLAAVAIAVAIIQGFATNGQDGGTAVLASIAMFGLGYLSTIAESIAPRGTIRREQSEKPAGLDLDR